jgi:hypothetical protein
MEKQHRSLTRHVARLLVGVLALAGCFVVTAVQAPAASAAHGEQRLRVGQRLTAGQYLVNGQYRAIMQSDGNFVLKKGSKVCWAAGTGGRGDSRSYIVMQSDANLVIYKYVHGPALWASHTTIFERGHLMLNVSVTGRVTLQITDESTYIWTIAFSYC